ncbi:hypothetical protein CR513_17504, partial [Mucuna pruriens]
MWDVVENGQYIPIDDGVEIPKSSWNANQKTRASKDLKKLPMEELFGTFKVHEMELKKDKGQRKWKYIALKAQNTQKGSLSKAFKVDESYSEASKEECYNEERSTPCQNIKIESKWKNNTKKYTKEVKDKSQVVCYECKKLVHFKFECPSLEKEKEKEKKKPFSKKKKGLMAT